MSPNSVCTIDCNKNMSKSGSVTYPCPHCGKDVLTTSPVCRACGFSAEYEACEDEFESEPQDDFDYDDFVAREFPNHAETTFTGDNRQLFVRFVILAIIASFLLTLFF